MRTRLLIAFGRWEAFLFVLLIATLAVGQARTPQLLSLSNLSVATAAYMEKAVIAIPMTMIILMGDIDLSVGSVLGLGSCVFGLLIADSWPLWPAIIAVLLLGAAAGLVNGLFITLLKLPSLVVTLGTLALYRGLATVSLGDRGVATFPSFVATFGYDDIPRTSIPWPVLVFVALFVPALVFLHGTRTGRGIYAVGNNAITSKYSGIQVDRLRVAMFVLAGLFSALAGLMLTARLGSARSDNGLGYELEVITAVLLGGVSIFGGKGSLLGVLLALLLLDTTESSLSLSGVSSNVQQVVLGGLLIASVLLTTGSKRVRDMLTQRARTRSALASSQEL